MQPNVGQIKLDLKPWIYFDTETSTSSQHRISQQALDFRWIDARKSSQLRFYLLQYRSKLMCLILCSPGMLLQFLTATSSINWNYSDVYIVCMSLYLKSMLDCINRKIESAVEKVSFICILWFIILKLFYHQRRLCFYLIRWWKTKNVLPYKKLKSTSNIKLHFELDRVIEIRNLFVEHVYWQHCTLIYLY